MKVQTKKVIAKEFLYLLLVIALGLVCFLSTYPYNFYLNNRDGNLGKIIVQKEKLADSLNKIENNLQSIDAPKYKLWRALNSSRYYTKSYDDFEKQFSIIDRINKLYRALNQSGYYTKSSTEFINQYFSDVKNDPFAEFGGHEIKDSLPPPPKYKKWKESEKIKSELIKANFEKSQIETKVLSFKDQVAIGCIALMLFFIMLFGVRYLYYTVKWSIITLKQ
ncbi:hypothetical protein [Flavobacterium sp. UBA6046]|uniref:hypothetical protein n=1 Tax=Flavobacterium sp. UBA6046 TaxID=1946552 RepID=UPI0025C420E9|nr:hypothetical protein [Flavobacterium sp. UBA6046]